MCKVCERMMCVCKGHLCVKMRCVCKVYVKGTRVQGVSVQGTCVHRGIHMGIGMRVQGMCVCKVCVNMGCVCKGQVCV